MRRSGATLAIVFERLRRERPAAAALAALSAAVAFLQRFDDAPAHLAGALLFGVLGAIIAALIVNARRNRDLLIIESTAPVYGRELARAHALYVCAATSAGTLAYWLVTAAYGGASAQNVLISFACAYAAAITMLNVRVPGTLSRAGIVMLIAAVTALTFAAGPYWPAALLLCGAAAFFGLRQYGEVLASA